MTTMRISLLVSLFFAASTTGVAGHGARSALAALQPQGKEQWVADVEQEHRRMAVTVDWVVLTAAIVGLGIAVGTVQPIQTAPTDFDGQQPITIRDGGARRLENSVNQRPQICRLPILRSNPADEAFSAVDYRRLYDNLEEGNDFAADDLRTIYLAYLNEDEANAVIASIDTNGDDVIDESELANLKLTKEFTEFLFNDMLACTVGGNDECVSYQVIIDFLNVFFGKTIVDEDLAAHIRSSSGDDACFTREELQNFESFKDNSGAASHMRFSVVLALACLLALLMLFM